MNAFFGIGLLAALMYWVMFGGLYFKIYLGLLAAYIVFTQLPAFFWPQSLARKLRMATWDGNETPLISSQVPAALRYSSPWIGTSRRPRNTSRRSARKPTYL
jgi:hypothetical protein